MDQKTPFDEMNRYVKGRNDMKTGRNIYVNKKCHTGSPRIDPPVPSSLAASLTVETALVLPLFLFAVLTVIMIGEAVRFSANLNASLMETAKKMSIYAYAGKNVAAGRLGGKVISMTAGKNMVAADLGKIYAEASPVEGGISGLSFIHSSVMGADQMIDLNAVWKMKIMFPLPGINGFKVIDRARIRAFTGYDNTRRLDRSGESEEMVFITEKGTVYHRDRNCRHLNIRISTVNRVSVKGLRNSSGGKYYPCEYCGKGTGDNLYITEDGDRYHTKISCPGLKRTVKTVPISEVGGRGPCAKCGY